MKCISWLDKISREYPQDNSVSRLQVLLDDGYTNVKWKKGQTTEDEPCTSLHDKTWPLNIFITDIEHNACIYSRSHVGCLCSVLVTGPDDKFKPVEIVAIGDMPSSYSKPDIEEPEEIEEEIKIEEPKKEAPPPKEVLKTREEWDKETANKI